MLAVRAEDPGQFTLTALDILLFFVRLFLANTDSLPMPSLGPI